MCKKLIYSCLILVVMAVPVLADPITATNPLCVDIDGQYGGTQAGFVGWGFDRSLTKACWNTTIDQCIVELCGINGSTGAMPGSRIRTDLCPDAGGGYGDLLQDFVFVGTTGTVYMGRDYFQVSVIGCIEPDTKYKVCVWSYDEAFQTYLCPPGSKWSAWSDVNPSAYLDSLGYGPTEGYNPTDYDDPCTTENESGVYKNPIPTLNRIDVMKNGATGKPFLCPPHHMSCFCVTSDEYGVLTFYGWWDGDTWSGSQHVPINGFCIIPEPATIALLGLGGLALLRRRRR